MAIFFEKMVKNGRFKFFSKWSKMLPNGPTGSPILFATPFVPFATVFDHFDHFHSENYNRAVHPLIIFKKAIVTISKLETEVRGSRKHLLLYIIPVPVMV